MTVPRTDDTAATVIIGQRVRSGSEDEFQSWQDGLNRTASTYPGFVGAEVSPPTDVQPDWVVVYRFDSIANLQHWLNSSRRQELLLKGMGYLDGPATQQVIAGGVQPADPLVTVVVTHRVNDEDVDEFLAWQDKVDAVEATFPGYRGSELFRPIEGVQDDWTAMYRFDTAAHLDAWLTSDERQHLLAEATRFNDFELRTVDDSFGSWFAFDANGEPAPPPSEMKSAIAVWAGLYPTVALLTLAMSPLKLPLWAGLLIGNLLSSFVMTFFTMPRYVSRLFGWWLRPAPHAPQPRTNLRGFGFILAINLVWVGVFFVGTRVVWTLP
jgi:antibiotic biosynthesis monooxygenase (ABM) superfamily enzyme